MTLVACGNALVKTYAKDLMPASGKVIMGLRALQKLHEKEQLETATIHQEQILKVHKY